MRLPRRPTAPFVLSVVAIVIALAAPAGAVLVNARGIANNAVESRHIRNGKVTTADLAPRAITNAKLGLGSVKAANLAAGAVGAAQVANESLTGDDLVDASITARELAPGVVGASSLAERSVGGSKLAIGAVDSAILLDGSISTSDLANSAIATVNLADGAVTATKLGSSAVGTTNIADLAVTTGKLADGAVTTPKLGTDAVTTPKLVDGSVTGAKLGVVVGAGVTATALVVADDAIDALPDEETDGALVPFAAELFDQGALFDPIAPTVLTAPSDGLYAVIAWISWDADNDGYREAQVLANGSIVAQDRRASGTGAPANRINQVVSALASLSTGQTVQLRLSHSAGNPLTADRVRVTMHRVGAAS